MVIRPEIHTFLDDVETFTAKKFSHRQEIEILVELSRSRSMEQVFRDITFFSKFLYKAFNILKRTGTNSAETEKLHIEFKDKLDKMTTLLKTLLKEAPEDIKEIFLFRFLSVSDDSMNSFFTLLYELSWIKNYELEQERAS